ncbi:class I SAM-dependent methyltransferase [Flavobacterium sp. UBA6135]|uniref:class I SAM-dependent methyltransferase n=1 Tax=Flavobacterium sp. UBA6135 TaxID=1946553 RepID=UPI0025C39367|nr:class I SAM-dependent methyltransferase [Flavobacterium sp. UBA6135]
MIDELLQPEIQSFICKNTGRPISDLALKKNPFPEVDYKAIINQIEARTKSKEKLPTWFNCENIVYPTKISIEQTSSEKTANYKSQLIKGDSLIDLTGGFGVDAYYFSSQIKRVIHCEWNKVLSKIVKHNFNKLNKSTIECFSGDSEEILKKLNQKLDWIYIDPSRRSDIKGKVFLLKDCSPNVPELLEFYFSFSDNLLIKSSPILDLSAGIEELKNVKSIHIVSVENEVKEILWMIEKNYQDNIQVKCVDLADSKPELFEFLLPSNAVATYSLPLNYLYEPKAALMKSGGFDEISQQFGIDKLHQNSQLFTSNELKAFCGRVFKIKKQFIYSKENMKLFLANTKANVTTRNFPITVDEIRKKFKIKDGGEIYCFFTTALDNHKIVLLCEKIK